MIRNEIVKNTNAKTLEALETYFAGISIPVDTIQSKLEESAKDPTKLETTASWSIDLTPIFNLENPHILYVTESSTTIYPNKLVFKQSQIAQTFYFAELLLGGKIKSLVIIQEKIRAAFPKAKIVAFLSPNISAVMPNLPPKPAIVVNVEYNLGTIEPMFLQPNRIAGLQRDWQA